MIRLENGFQQTGEAYLQIFSAQRDQHSPSLWRHANQPGFTEHFEVMGLRRFRHLINHKMLTTDSFGGHRQLSHDRKPQWITPSIQENRQGKILTRGMK